MWIILIEILLAPTAGLLWCVLVMFFCMCMEHTFFKRPIRMELTQKEIILIKEVLAGHISLPLVANDGLFVECVDRIERIFERFIIRSKQQTVQLEEVAQKLTVTQNECVLSDIQPYTLPQENDFEISQKEETASGLSIQELIDKHSNEWEREKELQEKEKLLASSIDIFRLPSNCYNVFRYRMSCETVKDVLQIMLYFGSRKSLLKIYWVGDTSVDILEAFMLDNELIYMQNYIYKSEYEDTGALQILRNNEKFPRRR